jgi:hypothetical protein
MQKFKCNNLRYDGFSSPEDETFKIHLSIFLKDKSGLSSIPMIKKISTGINYRTKDSHRKERFCYRSLKQNMNIGNFPVIENYLGPIFNRNEN